MMKQNDLAHPFTRYPHPLRTLAAGSGASFHSSGPALENVPDPLR